ncbi:MAG: hypothetical protein M0D53_17290 [Flavobacterium sp. JAD_PAG50586_2]|nr:MAG: hypothetical protein M0D53_17290 [Flavobacterium sp. JAD_PAG50586_2]
MQTERPKVCSTKPALWEETGNNTNGKIGLDYYLSGKSTLGVGVTGTFRDGNNRSDVNSRLSDANSVLDSTIIAKNREKMSSPMVE